jgi:hypothetical protein
MQRLHDLRTVTQDLVRADGDASVNSLTIPPDSAILLRKALVFKKLTMAMRKDTPDSFMAQREVATG